MHNQRLGKLGEDLAVKHLKREKYKILERNWRCQFGEVDIIAQKSDIICFIEVKTRTNTDKGLPQEAVNFHKQQHIKKSSQLFMMKYPDNSYRFDIIEIIDKELSHIEAAF